MMDQQFLKQRTKNIQKATYGLSGIKRAMDAETDKDTPNQYTLGALLAGMSAIADSINHNIYEIEERAGIPDGL